MKIFSAEQIRAWDAYTISHEPVTSIDLMERAALRIFGWIREKGLLGKDFVVCCGKGNNGGDGLALARMLSENNSQVKVFLVGDPETGSADFRENLRRLPVQAQTLIDSGKEHDGFRSSLSINDSTITNIDPSGSNSTIIIDAIFGSGLNKPVEGIAADVIRLINESALPVLAIDLPSGLPTDGPAAVHQIVKATTTLAFTAKLAYFFPSKSSFVGELELLDIGLHPQYAKDTETIYELTDDTIARSIYRPRDDNSHKGTHGHALLVAGSYGKMGAAVLAAAACLRSGAGLLTCHIPASGYQVLQSTVPEAMVMTDYNSSFNTKFEGDLSVYKTIGIGPGIGTGSETANLLAELMMDFKKPMVIDADALNILSRNKRLVKQVPAGSILTPHPKEFERLFGPAQDDQQRFQLAVDKASEMNCVIVLKGHHTLVAANGKGYFNNTGNAGLAKGGTGDTLTGIITGLLAQGYEPVNAAILGVYLHGLAADVVVGQLQSRESLLATDLITSLGQAFNQLSLHKPFFGPQ